MYYSRKMPTMQAKTALCRKPAVLPFINRLNHLGACSPPIFPIACFMSFSGLPNPVYLQAYNFTPWLHMFGCPKLTFSSLSIFLLLLTKHSHQHVPVFLQPLIPFMIIRHNAQNLAVKAFGMIHFLSVAKLMYDNAVQNFRRRQHQ